MLPVQVVLQRLPGADLLAAVRAGVLEQSLEVAALNMVPAGGFRALLTVKMKPSAFGTFLFNINTLSAKKKNLIKIVDNFRYDVVTHLYYLHS